MGKAEEHADLAHAILRSAYNSAGTSPYLQALADGLGQIASAVSALAEQQDRIERAIANLR